MKFLLDYRNYLCSLSLGKKAERGPKLRDPNVELREASRKTLARFLRPDDFHREGSLSNAPLSNSLRSNHFQAMCSAPLSKSFVAILLQNYGGVGGIRHL
jgi:hypothetical protein